MHCPSGLGFTRPGHALRWLKTQKENIMAKTKLHKYAGRLWLTLDGQAIGYTEARQRVAEGDARAPILRQYIKTERNRARHALATEHKIIPALQRYFAEVIL